MALDRARQHAEVRGCSCERCCNLGILGATGLLQTLQREQAQLLMFHYGGGVSQFDCGELGFGPR
jgi:BRCT domain type II-containing protein